MKHLFSFITILALFALAAGCNTDSPVAPATDLTEALSDDAPATTTLPVAAGTTGPREGFMLGTLKSTVAIADDISFLADRGARIVRFPVYFSFEPSLPEWFRRIDAALAVTSARGMVLVIDFHHPGADFNSTISNVDDFVSKWSQVANRYKTNSSHIWYDLCNEPNHASWPDVALKAAKAIRAVDPTHRIIYAVKGDRMAPISAMTPLPGISNQSIEVHFWDWRDVQFNGVPYPSPGRTREDLRTILKRCSLRSQQLGMPVYVGEVGIMQSHPNAPRFLRDFTDICDAEGLALTIHAFREWEGWDYERNPQAWTVLTDWLRR